MIFHKNRLIFGVIRRIIKTVFNVVYKIIKAFNLHLTLFVLLLGIVLAIVGVINKEDSSITVYAIVLILSLVYAVIKTFNNVLKTKNKNSRVKIVKVNDSEEEQQPQPKHQTAQAQQQNIQQPTQNNYLAVDIQPSKPKYYAVKNNPSYVYAEYDDRYELFLRTSTGLKKIRVDYKR